MPYRAYMRGIYDKFGFLATWLPGQKLNVGDIGTLENGAFKKDTSLDAIGLSLGVDIGDTPMDLDHSSGSEIQFTGQAKAGTPNDATAGSAIAEAQIRFGEVGGFVLRAKGCIEHRVSSRSELRNAITQARTSGAWRNDWVVVDRLYTAESVTVVVCNSTTGGLNLRATAQLDPGPFDIASATLGVQASAWEGDITRVIAASRIAPMYSAARVRSGIFRSDRLNSAKLQLRADERLFDVVPLTLQDALDED